MAATGDSEVMHAGEVFTPMVLKGGMVFKPFVRCVGSDDMGCQLKGLVLAGHGDRCLMHGGPSFDTVAGDHAPDHVDIGKLPQLSAWPTTRKTGRAKGRERRRKGRR